MSFVNTSLNPITLGDGRTIGPDDPVGRIDPKNEINRRHIEAGRPIEVKAKNTRRPKSAEKEKE